MKIEELQKYKKILIVGYGKEGESVERFFKKYVPSATIGITDKKYKESYLDDQEDYDLAIKTPGIHKSKITIPYTTATNIFFANISNIIIGVTGSKGKSTTTSLIYEMIKTSGKKVHIVGNIGNPMLDELDSIEQDDIVVCELSSYQLDDIQHSPHISVVVSLFPEHMNYHGSLEAYYKAKHHIIRYAKKDDYFVYNSDFPQLQEWADAASCISVPFIKTMPSSITDIPLLGEHNKSNIRGAITAVRLLNIEENAIAQAVKRFEPLRHRLQLVGEFKGVQFYDDAISTTPESTIAALKSLDTIGTIFLGGENRGYDFSSLIPYLKDKNIQHIVLFPESGEDIKKVLLKETEYRPHLFETIDMEKAVEYAYKVTPKGTICLLSTASPSYSIWKNFEEKGDLFQEYVLKLGKDK